MASDAIVLAAEKVEKRFGSVAALDGVSLAIPRGRVVGLVGRNGGGKTTLLRTFLGLFLPTRGECRTLGVPVRDLGDRELSRIGAVQQENRFLNWMSGRAHLSFVKSFYERWDEAREKKLVDVCREHCDRPPPLRFRRGSRSRCRAPSAGCRSSPTPVPSSAACARP